MRFGIVFVSFVNPVAMAPRLSPAEQDVVLKPLAPGTVVTQTLKQVAARRCARGVEMVSVTAIRRFLRGKSHRHSKVETRGRMRVFTRKNVLAMDAARCKMIQHFRGALQATWSTVQTKARAQGR